MHTSIRKKEGTFLFPKGSKQSLLLLTVENYKRHYPPLLESLPDLVICSNVTLKAGMLKYSYMYLQRYHSTQHIVVAQYVNT